MASVFDHLLEEIWFNGENFRKRCHAFVQQGALTLRFLMHFRYKCSGNVRKDPITAVIPLRNHH